MSCKKITLFATLVISMIAIAAVAQSQEPTEPAMPAQTYGSEADDSEVGEESVVVEETWTISENPQSHMTESRANFVKKDTEGTARELRSAAEIIR